jgi:hypothetical protein
MNRAKKMLLLLFAGSVIVLISMRSITQAEDSLMKFGKSDGPAGPMAPLMMLVTSANLTPDQQINVERLLESNRADVAPLFVRLHSLHERIAGELLSPGSISMSDLDPLRQRAARIQGRIDERMLETALKIRNVMTAGQRSRIAQANQKLHTQVERIMN